MSTTPLEIPIARFSAATVNKPVNSVMSWPDLIRQLTRHKPVECDIPDTLTAKELKDRLDSIKKRFPCFSPVIYKEKTTRAKENVVSVHGFVADVEDGTTINDLLPSLVTADGKPLAFIWFTTFKSRAGFPRIRIFFPLKYPVLNAQWEPTWRKLTHFLLDGHNDENTKDCSRLHFFPICPAQWIEEADAGFQEGELLNPADYPDIEPEVTARKTPAPRRQSEPPPADDNDLLKIAYRASNGAKIEALYRGDQSGYSDQSKADQALCNHLAFYAGPDPARIDRLFRNSGLMRDKWDEVHYAGGETYGQHTAQKALDGRTVFYSPSGSRTAKQNKYSDSSTSVSEEVDAEGGEKRGPSVATRLMEIARERFTLWHTDEGVAYATVPTGKHTETWGVETTGFRDHLSRAYFAEAGKAIAPAAMQAAVQMLGMFARMEGPEKPIYTRKADLTETEGAIYLDLCNDKWQAVKIAADGWAVVDNAPVAFRRTKGMVSLCTPQRGGNIADLRNFINAPEKSEGGDDLFTLMVAWLLGALGPHRPYPILQLIGEQGTAKSCAARFLRDLVDPARPDLRREPKEPQDLAIAATNAFVVAFDNVSGIPPWLSDMLCTVSTGGGYGTRKLFTDDGEQLFNFLRPVLLTGIGEASTRGDFLQRALLVSLPVITEANRKDEADVKPLFDAARPRLLGALLTAVATGLANLPHTQLAEKPRMADFARWVSACEPACPWEPGAFLKAYVDNQKAGGDVALEADKIAPLVIQLVEGQRDPQGVWTGTAAELLEALGNLITDAKEKASLPKSPRALSVALKRIAPALRAMKEITVSEPVKGTGGRREFTIKQSSEQPGKQPDIKSGANSGANGANSGANHFAPLDNDSIDDGDVPESGASGAKAQKNPPYTSLEKMIKGVRKGREAGEEYSKGNFAPLALLRHCDEKVPSSQAEFIAAAYRAARNGLMPKTPVDLGGGRSVSTPGHLLLSLTASAHELQKAHGDDWREQPEAETICSDIEAIAFWWQKQYGKGDV